MFRIMMDFSDDLATCLSGVKGKFDQSAAISREMATEASNMPDSSFINYGCKVSLVEHIDQLIDRCEEYKKEQALQKADLILSDIPQKVTDQNAQVSLINQSNQVIDLLNSIF